MFCVLTTLAEQADEHPISFVGPADGYDEFLVRRLSDDRTASVQIRIDYALLQHDISTITNRLVWHSFSISDHRKSVNCWIEQYTNPVSEFVWDHYREPSANSRKWIATDGKISLRLGEPETETGYGYAATIIASNLTFLGATTISLDRVSFDNVRVGWKGID